MGANADGVTGQARDTVPVPAEPGTCAARRRRLRRLQRHLLAQHAQARRGPRGRGDVAVQPRGQQGQPGRRHDRPGVQRDRPAVGRSRLEDGHAPAGGQRPSGPQPPSVGDRPDGVAELARSGHAAAPRRGARKPAGSRLPGRAGRARVLGPGQLHLRVRAAGGEPAVRGRGGDRGPGADDHDAVHPRRIPPPRRADRRARPAARLRLRWRVRVRTRPDPRRPGKGP